MKTINKILLLVLCLMTVEVVNAQDITGNSTPVRISFKAKDVTAPNIFMDYKNGGMTTAEGKVIVSIQILDDGGLGAISINDDKIDGAKKDSLTVMYQFDPGQDVNIVAKDVANNVKEKTFLIKGAAPVPSSIVASDSPTPQHKFYALIMGVQEYDDPAIARLDEPIKDATMLKQILTEKYTFEEKDITFLKNPTNDEIELAFEALSKTVTPQDFLLIFYAGHGFFDKQKNIGYWLPKDARKANNLRWFRNSALVEDIGGITSLHTLLIADACFSGGIFKTREAFNNFTPDVSELLRTPSRKAITSGSLTTVPDKSVFMKYLLKSLSENKKMYLPVDDLFYEVKQGVTNNSDTNPLFGTIQKVGDEGGTFVFIQRTK